jgi:hypothetical protein
MIEIKPVTAAATRNVSHGSMAIARKLPKKKPILKIALQKTTTKHEHLIWRIIKGYKSPIPLK